jgi:Protein of unknown function (DUF3800)
MLNAKSTPEQAWLDAQGPCGILEARTPKEVAEQFSEWASLFSGKLFVKVVAYIDESGTHDKTGALPGSSEVVIAGLVDWRDDWVKFCVEWQAVLSKYAAPYFHFKEWAGASMAANGKAKLSSKSPYAGWSAERLNDFLLELAAVAGSGSKVIVGGYINTKQFHAAKISGKYNPASIPGGGDPYTHCATQFFKRLPEDILSAWPYWNDPVSIFFDRIDDPAWRNAIAGAHHLCSQKDPRIDELAFVDKKKPAHLPLQAADMIAYRFRWHAERVNKGILPETLSRFDKLMLDGLGRQFHAALGVPFTG